MRFHTKTKPPVSMESVAFADTVINLFVFFFITFSLFATFDRTQKGSLPIELPKAKPSWAENHSPTLSIMIARNGTVYVDSLKTPLSRLLGHINDRLSSRKEKNVILSADRLISLEQFISVLDVIRTSKASSISLETEIDRPS